ncbi:MAG: hypothetical protein WDM81_17660 [Rhizomicrobium sp.]
MPLTAQGAKPAILSEVTRIWAAASVSGRVRLAALRATDFLRPRRAGVACRRERPGRARPGPAGVPAGPRRITPHDFAYVPDIARAIVTLLDAPDDAFGQVWNMPCAPTTTPRAILQLGADALGVKLRVRTIPQRLWPVLRLLLQIPARGGGCRFHLGPPPTRSTRRSSRRASGRT